MKTKIEIDLKVFLASNSEEESFGSKIAEFYKEYFDSIKTIDHDDMNEKIINNVKAICKNILKGAKSQIKKY